MSAKLLFLQLTILLATAFSLPPSSDPDSILVIGENEQTQTSHSRFIQSIASYGKQITYKPAQASDFNLFTDGEYTYDAIILLCPTANLKKTLPLHTLLRFIDSGHSLYVTASSSYSSYISSVVESIGVDLEDRSKQMTDHQNIFTSLDTGDHTYIRAGGRTESSYLFGDAIKSPASEIIFSGPGATLFKDNELVDSVIWGSGSSYATDGKTLLRVPRASGTSAVLAATLSTRTGSRATYWGSFDTLSDKVFEIADNVHEQAMTALLAWTLGMRGVLKANNLRYESVDDSGDVRNEFRVKDHIDVAVDIQVWDGFKKHWLPFDIDDMQIEFVMLNPWVRTRLNYTGNDQGTYSTSFVVPDQIGVYKFSIQYFRAGLTPLSLEKVVPIRPYLHNEYERFIPMASPYYAASFSMLIGVFVMGIVLLFAEENPKQEKKD